MEVCALTYSYCAFYLNLFNYPEKIQTHLDKQLGIYEDKMQHIRSESHWIYVKTGDKKGAETNANIFIRLYSDKDKISEPIKVNYKARDYFNRGQVDSVKYKFITGNVRKIDVWRDEGNVNETEAEADWFCDVIVVHNPRRNQSSYFPVNRWLKSGQLLSVYERSTFLPQCDPQRSKREEELAKKREMYGITVEDPELPAQVEGFPKDEQFSYDYAQFLGVIQYQGMTKAQLAVTKSKKWEKIEDIAHMYNVSGFPLPQTLKDKDEIEDDVRFGAQRLTGTNPNQIRLCTAIPPNFAVTDELVGPFLENMSIKEALYRKKLFIINYQIMDGVPTYQHRNICHPIALFFVNKQKQLVPVAIQLFQEAGPNNPVFTPADKEGAWTLAKMWFNSADSAVHQSLSHLGFTHLMMEGPLLAMHRQLSPNHPVFRLLAPHFLFLVAINRAAIRVLLAPGGWVDQVMSVGAEGMLELIRRRSYNWKMNIDGCLPRDLRNRGVDDPDVLPNYSYRDDGMLLYKAIKKYVKNIINYYYSGCRSSIIQDYEIQYFIEDLITPKEDGGIGIQGYPQDGVLDTKSELIKVLTSIIFTSSVQHAAVNFGQYDNYGYPLHYALMLDGNPPTNKEIPVSTSEILAAHPDKGMMAAVLNMMSVLSSRGTQPLGQFEFQYQYDPKVLQYEHRFRKDLVKIARIINRRNRTRQKPYAYNYLLPEFIPNAISI